MRILEATWGSSMVAMSSMRCPQRGQHRASTPLEERGASPIHEIAAVFDGKRVRVERVTRQGARGEAGCGAGKKLLTASRVAIVGP